MNPGKRFHKHRNVAEHDFARPDRLKDGGIRVDMGRGFSKDADYAVLVDSKGPHSSTYVWHLGSSGMLHCFGKNGHNTLLPEQVFCIVFKFTETSTDQ